MRKYLDAGAGGVLIALNLALGPLLHRWRTRWHATPDEVKEPLPGDELVKAPTWTYTHAVRILAPRAAVWPWLAQIGQGRGGFFSYEVLENLVGCDIHNVLELRSEWQQLRPGDRVRLHANGFGPRVSILDPGRALVLGGPPDASGSQASWGFYLHQTDDGVTRLIERGRHAVGKGIRAKLGYGPYLIDPIGFVMSRKMLKTIKRLAEAAPWTPTFASNASHRKTDPLREAA
jgi:hypothetical protein